MIKFTVGDLRHALKSFDDSTELEFEGGLTFSHIKYRESALVLFEQIQAPMSDEFRSEHPDIQVVFYRAPPGGHAYTMIELGIL